MKLLELNVDQGFIIQFMIIVSFTFFSVRFLLQPCIYYEASLIAQLVKNPPAIQEILVQFLGREDLLEKGKATHSSIFSEHPRLRTADVKSGLQVCW